MTHTSSFLLALAALCLAACDSSGEAPGPEDASCANPQADPANDATSDTSSPDVGDVGDAAVAPDAAVPTMGVRVANMSNDGEALDFCLASMAAPYTTPHLNNGSGLASRHVSTYIPLAPGSYKVVVVPGTATDCSTAILGEELTGIRVAAAGDFTTVVLMGGGTLDGGASIPLGTAAFVDEHTSTAKVHARVINASPYISSQVVRLETQSGAKLPLYTTTPYGQVPTGMPGTVSVNGFFDADPEAFPAFQREALLFDVGTGAIRRVGGAAACRQRGVVLPAGACARSSRSRQRPHGCHRVQRRRSFHDRGRAHANSRRDDV